MIVAAMLMMLAAGEPQGSAECAASASRGPDFMAMLAGEPKHAGKKLHERLGGKIVDPPARIEDHRAGLLEFKEGFTPLPVDLPQDRARPGAGEHASHESGGTCSAA